MLNYDYYLRKTCLKQMSREFHYIIIHFRNFLIFNILKFASGRSFARLSRNLAQRHPRIRHRQLCVHPRRHVERLQDRPIHRTGNDKIDRFNILEDF